MREKFARGRVGDDRFFTAGCQPEQRSGRLPRLDLRQKIGRHLQEIIRAYISSSTSEAVKPCPGSFHAIRSGDQLETSCASTLAVRVFREREPRRPLLFWDIRSILSSPRHQHAAETAKDLGDCHRTRQRHAGRGSPALAASCSDPDLQIPGTGFDRFACAFQITSARRRIARLGNTGADDHQRNSRQPGLGHHAHRVVQLE